MTELYLLRHAHAGNWETWDGPDEDRPLSDKGERQADRLGRFLAGVGFEPDAMKSPAEAAQFLKNEMNKWGKVVRERNIKVE